MTDEKPIACPVFDVPFYTTRFATDNGYETEDVFRTGEVQDLVAEANATIARLSENAQERCASIISMLNQELYLALLRIPERTEAEELRTEKLWWGFSEYEQQCIEAQLRGDSVLPVRAEEHDPVLKHAVPLIWSSGEEWKTRHVITAEQSSKWYTLWLVPSAKTWSSLKPHRTYYTDLEDTAAKMQCSAFVDHVPNPMVLRAWCEEHGYHLDRAFWLALLKRWKVETT
jgi:hypothetical protein